MKFSKRGMLNPQLPGRVTWVSDDESCWVNLRDGSKSPWIGRGNEVWIDVHAKPHDFYDIHCEPDGVAPFIVRELMDILCKWYDKDRTYNLEIQLVKFLHEFKPKATMPKYHAYKEKQRRQV